MRSLGPKKKAAEVTRCEAGAGGIQVRKVLLGRELFELGSI